MNKWVAWPGTTFLVIGLGLLATVITILVGSTTSPSDPHVIPIPAEQADVSEESLLTDNWVIRCLTSPTDPDSCDWNRP